MVTDGEPPPGSRGGDDRAARHLRLVDASPRPARSAPRPRWITELKASITSAADLARRLELTAEERDHLARAERKGLPMRITPHYFKLVDPRDPACPIRLQCVPRLAEDETHPGDLADPLGEEAHEVAPHLVQRYPDRALLLATDQCAVYCRFCTRSRIVGDGKGPTPKARLREAFDYLRAHPEVKDLILSGGDPLGMTTDRLVALLRELRKIPSIETIRLATRMPVTLPSRITAELVRALRPFHPLWVMTHFNHPRELAPSAIRAVERLVDAGFPVMNQTVLLRGVNDDAATLTELFRGLVRHRARPYYLLQMDPVVGTSHLRTPIARGIEIMEALHGRLSGIAIPKYIVDTPHGMGKVPLVPDYVVSRDDIRGVTRLRTPRGVEVDYVDP